MDLTTLETSPEEQEPVDWHYCSIVLAFYSVSVCSIVLFYRLLMALGLK